MAFLAAVPALIGSATAAAGTLSTIATVVSVGSTLIGGIQKRNQIKSEAKIERFNATNREIERKQNLARALAIQNVRQGASGQIGAANAFTGELSTQSSFSQTIDDAGTNFRANQLQANARDATTNSLLSAGSEAFKFGSRRAKRGKTSGT